MITYSTALELIKQKLKEIEEDIPYAILLNEIVEKEDFWIFRYDSEKYIQTKNSDFSIIGTAPFIIDKKHGNIYEMGTLENTYIQVFEKIYKEYQDNPEELNRILDERVISELKNSTNLKEKNFDFRELITGKNIIRIILITIFIILVICVFFICK